MFFTRLTNDSNKLVVGEMIAALYLSVIAIFQAGIKSNIWFNVLAFLIHLSGVVASIDRVLLICLVLRLILSKSDFISDLLTAALRDFGYSGRRSNLWLEIIFRVIHTNRFAYHCSVFIRITGAIIGTKLGTPR